MPDNIVDVDAFTDPVQAPADGDDASEPIIQAAPQALANRTRNLKNRLDTIESSGNIVLGSGKVIDANQSNSMEVGTGGARVRLTTTGEVIVEGGGSIVSELGVVKATAGKVQAGNGFEHVTAQSVVAMATGVAVGGGYVTPGAGPLGTHLDAIAFGEGDPETGILKIPVPHNATITRIRVLANCSTTPSSSSLSLLLRRIRHNKVSPFTISTATMWTGASKSTSGNTLLDSNASGTFTSAQIDRSRDTLQLEVSGGADGGSTCDVLIRYIELTYTMPGPVER